MTTREFIERTYNTTNEKWGRYGYERRCSSVLTDRDGNVYSYGYHYPLAFKVAGLDFINTQGYSVTTAKHINWAWGAVGYSAIGVKLWREDVNRFNSGDEDTRLDVILGALKREKSRIVDQMVARQMKGRTNTQVYASLSHDLERVNENLRKVTEVV